MTGQHPLLDEATAAGDLSWSWSWSWVREIAAPDNSGRITGDLTPECSAALVAVLEALGKKRGPEDDRTQP